MKKVNKSKWKKVQVMVLIYKNIYERHDHKSISGHLGFKVSWETLTSCVFNNKIIPQAYKKEKVEFPDKAQQWVRSGTWFVADFH